MKKVSREEAKQILSQLTSQELSLYKQLNAAAQGVNEADIKSVVQNIAKGWKGWSTAMLMAVMMNSNIASAMNTYSPETYKAIDTELSIGNPKQKTVNSLDFSETFKSGATSLQNSEAIKEKIAGLKKWADDNKGTNYKITIVAGESNVTNPTGYEQKGSLAKARAEMIKQLVGQVVTGPIDIQVVKGTEKYVKGKDKADDPKYTREQFIRIDISVEADDLCSFAPKEKDIKQGTAATQYVTFNKVVSGEGDVTISPGQIPDRLVILDGNGNVKGDTGYVTTERSKHRDWTYTPKYVYELTKAAQDGSQKGLQGVEKITANTYDELLSKLQSTNSPDMKHEEVGPYLNLLRNMIKKGIHEFVIYKNMGSGKVQFSDSKGDVRAVVYSPVGKTGYDLVGKCYN
tara:strand:+ start:2124 stop:3329 length:1206 start_codon:yes stop_codon:yes gene_type:complete